MSLEYQLQDQEVAIQAFLNLSNDLFKDEERCYREVFDYDTEEEECPLSELPVDKLEESHYKFLRVLSVHFNQLMDCCKVVIDYQSDDT